MAKALYGFLTWTESINTEDMKQWLTDTLQVEWACCLHDKDVHKDGTLKKPHVHWLIGYEKSRKSIKDLLKIFFSRWHYTPTREVKADPEFLENFVSSLSAEGVGLPPLPPSASLPVENVVKPLVTRFIQMNSSQGAEDYLEHKNQPEKYQYSGLSEHSEYWCITDYLTYQEKRESKKLNSASEIAQLLQYIRKNRIYDYVALLDALALDTPELLGLAFQKAYSVEKYLGSWDLYDRLKNSEMEVEKLKEALAYQKELNEHQQEFLDYYKNEIEKLEGYQQEISHLQNVVEENAVKMAEMRISYIDVTGENFDVD